MSIRFTWDREKAARNAQKHGVTFEEAATVFRNPLASIFDDEAYSEDEPRELIIGHSARNRLLIVSYVERSDMVRIISARKVDPDERKSYERAHR
jgi:uncharacterized DUF497 family protein